VGEIGNMAGWAGIRPFSFSALARRGPAAETLVRPGRGMAKINAPADRAGATHFPYNAPDRRTGRAQN